MKGEPTVKDETMVNIKPKVKVEPKDKPMVKVEEERRWTDRKRKLPKLYTPPVETVKVTGKRQKYIQPSECPTNRPDLVPYDLAHWVPEDIVNEFMVWLTDVDIGPHWIGKGALFQQGLHNERDVSRVNMG